MTYLLVCPSPAASVYADSSNSLKSDAQPTLSLKLNPSALTISSLDPNAPAKTASLSITVTTDNPTGYRTTLSTNSSSETCLMRPSERVGVPPAPALDCDSSNHIIGSVAGSFDLAAGTNNPSKLAANQWGASLATSFSADPSTDIVWFKIPSSTEPATIKQTDAATATAGDSQTLTIGAKVDYSLPPTAIGDEYQNTIAITAVSNSFSAVDPPAITGISPPSGSPDGDETITISGDNLNYAYQVFIDLNNNGNQESDEKCMHANITNPNSASTTITCQTPAAPAGTYDVVVKTWGGTTKTGTGGTGTADDDYTYQQTQSPPIGAGCPDAVPVASFSDATIANIVVDRDANMIPIRYTGDTSAPQWVVADPNIHSNPDSDTDADWYDYQNRQWANVAMVTTPASYQTVGTTVPESDVLAYYVYIPRFAYEVQRRDAVDAPIICQTLFDVRFENNTAGLKTPIATTSTGTPGSGVHQFYQAARSNNRAYPDHDTRAEGTTTWATHPAFWWDKDSNGIRASDGSEELNGIWVGKFETTGSLAKPTVKPNLKSQISQAIGAQFATAKGVGPNYTDTGGNSGKYGQNYHGFASTAANLNAHQQKNTEWGAAAYLSTSLYGVGPTNPKVQNNSFYDISEKDDNGNSGYGITGCGPANDDSDDEQYEDCSAYHTALGQLASTTQNPTGIYDMAGGAYEHVMASLTTVPTGSSTNGMTTSPALKYLDLYGVNINLRNVFGTVSTLRHKFGTLPTASYDSEQFYNNDVCTYETCGGEALHETRAVQSVTLTMQSWGTDRSYFVYPGGMWFRRGGYSYFTAYAGIFASHYSQGASSRSDGFRLSLSVF
jgi:hypothetical protein